MMLPWFGRIWRTLGIYSTLSAGLLRRSDALAEWLELAIQNRSHLPIRADTVNHLRRTGIPSEEFRRTLTGEGPSGFPIFLLLEDNQNIFDLLSFV